MPKFLIEREIAGAGQIAPSDQMVREHARQGGFRANRVSEIRSVIDPTTAESDGKTAAGTSESSAR